MKNPSLLDPKVWRKAALAHALDLIAWFGAEYAMDAADRAERESEGVLEGLGKRVREEVQARRPG